MDRYRRARQSPATALVRLWRAHRAHREGARNPMRWQAVCEALAWSSDAYLFISPYSLGSFTDARLAQAWVESSRALGQATTPARTWDLVEARATFLEEMEARNPDGVAAWLAADPATSPDPLPFLAGSRGTGTLVDWDLLIP